MLFNRIHHEFTTSIPAVRVTEQIRMRLPSGRFRADSEFFGYVTENSFKIRRNRRYNTPLLASYRNSFSPVAIGMLEANDTGTNIKLKLRMNISVGIFIVFFRLILAYCTFIGILACIFDSFSDGAVLVLTSFFMTGEIELLLFFSFRLPAKRFIERLEEILKYD